jgi:hypothetical protein
LASEKIFVWKKVFKSIFQKNSTKRMGRLHQTSPIIIFAAIAAIGGCHSVAETHHSRLQRLHRTHGEICEISAQLRDIEQIMLYVGRVRESPLADAALDVAIAIEGEPDELERRYAETVTMDEIGATGARALKLVKQLRAMEALSVDDRMKAVAEAQSIRTMEGEYKLLKRLISGFTAAIGAAAIIFIAIKFF